MAKNSVGDWSQNADANTDVAGINIAEGCPAAGLNNAMRAIMAQIAAYVATLVTQIASAADVWVGTAVNRIVAPKSLYDAAAPVTLTDAATIAVDMSTGLNFTVTLGGNRTLANPTNAKIGQSGIIRVQQDSTGSRSLAFGSSWLLSSTTPNLTNNAGGVTILSYFVYSATQIYVSAIPGFAS